MGFLDLQLTPWVDPLAGSKRIGDSLVGFRNMLHQGALERHAEQELDMQREQGEARNRHQQQQIDLQRQQQEMHQQDQDWAHSKYEREFAREGERYKSDHLDNMMGRLAASKNPYELDQVAQELQRHGYQVEVQGRQAAPLPGGLPPMPQSKPIMPQTPAQQPAAPQPAPTGQAPQDTEAPGTSIGKIEVQRTARPNVMPEERGLQQLEALSRETPAADWARQPQAIPAMGGQPAMSPGRPSTMREQALMGSREPLSGDIMADRAPLVQGQSVQQPAREVANPPQLLPETVPGQEGSQAQHDPMAPPGSRYIVRDQNGQVVGHYDHDSIRSFQQERVNATFGPLLQTSDPLERSLAQQARDMTLGRLGTVGVEDAIKEGLNFYQKRIAEEVKPMKRGMLGGGGVGGAAAAGVSKSDFDRGLKLNAQSLAEVREIRQDTRYATVEDDDRFTREGLSALSANNGLGDTLAVKSIVKKLNGANSSDKEFNQIYGAAGAYQELWARVNKLTDGGKLPTEMKSQLHEAFIRGQAQVQQRRAEAGKRAYQAASSAALRAGANEEEAAMQGDAAQQHFTGVLKHQKNRVGVGDRPSRQGVLTRSKPAGQQTQSGAAKPVISDEQRKRSIDRAREALRKAGVQ